MNPLSLTVAAVAAAVCFAPAGPAQKPATHPFQFDKYSAEVYKGAPRTPDYLREDADGQWHEADTGKPAQPPAVTFAGEYDLAAYSCGTCCRFYQMASMRSGKQMRSVHMFDAGDPPPATKDGSPYVPILYFKPDSRLLIVQYELNLCTTRREACRQRYFVFENGRFRPLSKTLPFCTREGDEPE